MQFVECTVQGKANLKALIGRKRFGIVNITSLMPMHGLTLSLGSSIFVSVFHIFMNIFHDLRNLPLHRIGDIKHFSFQ